MLNLTKLLDPNEREVKRHLAVAAAVNELEPELKALDDAGLRARSDELRQQARDGHDLDELLIEAFAICREASRRTIGLRHFDVQLVGGIVLHQGKIAEMKTGEGKTLVASLALYLNALAGKGVHLVTVNDYLARRDAGWMGPIFHLLGLSVGVNVGTVGTFVYDPEFLDETHPDSRLQHLRPATKKDAYLADITYATNSELAFDYLRDNMALDLNQCSQRPLHYGIVDEVDSILIDEARTPHIISGQSEESTEKYYEYARWAGRLVEEEDYEVDLKHKSASLTEQGIAKMERWTGIRNIYDLENVIEAHQINQALKAKTLFGRDQEYLVKDGEVIIVDEFTGRTMPGRRWSDGLHQAVEAKEGVKVQQEQKTIATITVQNYFRQYEKLAGMTGTALTEAEEFHKIYGLDVVAIPTNQRMVRIDSPDVIYKTEKSKFEAVIEEILEMYQQNRPVLVGTVSVEKSERLANMLERRGVKHNVLNAKQHEREAAIVAAAGQPAAVTIATNMAGRGTDIVLGPGVTDVGGLHIIGTERHESRRIDNQLRGRAGRQGDPGSSKFFISLEDDLMKIFGPAADRIGRLMDSLEVEPIEHPWVARSIAGAQKKVEGMHFDARKHVVEYDDVMNKQRQIVYEERRKVLEGADARGNILEYVKEIVDKGIEVHCESRHPENWDMDALVRYLSAYLPIAPGSQIPEEVVSQGRTALADHLNAAAADAYDKKVEEIGPELMPLVEKDVMLRTIDWQWMEYLTQMEHFREGVGLRAYGQRDPLVEYKNEALEMFNELRDRIQGSIVARIFRVQIQQNAPPPKAPPIVRQILESGPGDPDGAAGAGSNGAPKKQRAAAPAGAAAGAGGAAAAKLGRNDPCWCGSGKKYKRCHGK
ncbi:MAG TPA: preprotein translocase subunit SecA [Candidatus Dormibacteraeota bacterium]|nr:preprotein translocase subunit SecA [Candidatus Dormibacteraeota bacterium]